MVFRFFSRNSTRATQSPMSDRLVNDSVRPSKETFTWTTHTHTQPHTHAHRRRGERDKQKDQLDAAMTYYLFFSKC